MNGLASNGSLQPVSMAQTATSIYAQVSRSVHPRQKHYAQSIASTVADTPMRHCCTTQHRQTWDFFRLDVQFEIICSDSQNHDNRLTAHSRAFNGYIPKKIFALRPYGLIAMHCPTLGAPTGDATNSLALQWTPNTCNSLERSARLTLASGLVNCP